VAAQIAAAQNTDAGAAGPIQRVAFEVVSIRPYDPTAATAAGGRGGGGRPQICGRTLRVDPGRISVSGTTLFTLIALAYGKNCESANAAELVSGGPAWLKTDRFDIQATMAEGVTHSSVQQLLRGEAPGLQAMLQTLLSDRFKIVLRRETREMPVYLLTVAKNGHKLRPAKEGDPIGLGVMGRMIEATRASMVDLATGLTRLTGRPVLDRTNLSGEFTFGIAFAPFDSPPGSTGPSLFSVLEDDLGLKLEGAREKIEVLTVAHAEKPTEN
jgi:uncharacterized protein (TIGR03435 family)